MKVYKVGMYGGSFNPLHIGYIEAIVEAANMCKKLYVVLSVTNDKNEIDYKERYTWLTSVTKDLDNVEILIMFDECNSKNEHNWIEGRNKIKKMIKEKIDVVFAGSDYKDKNIWEELYEESEIYYFKRTNISSTQIRSNPFKYYEYLPKCVRPYYNKKVLVVGTESCGKSTLIRNLSKVYNTTYVEERGRYVCIDCGGEEYMQPKHYLDILYEHKASEKDKMKDANKVLFVDTDAIVTYYYYMLTFKDANEYSNDYEQLAKLIAKQNKYDLCIFLEPDVMWVQDGTRIHGEEKVRWEHNKLLKKLFDEVGIKYVTINGDYQKRYVKTKELVDKLMEI